ncbi:TspO/MBR family protein [Actinacidiphila glaucinigra]|uniref:TspO/MBR family protein n=1 Tax=Actinacidiphila glaucinigra TaxID=235986 RepID=UPI0036E4AE30
MRLISERDGRGQEARHGRGGRPRRSHGPGMRVRWHPYAAAAMAAAAAAAAGAAAVNPDSAWYTGLAKPRWQPPSWAFGALWTPLYASVAWSAGRAFDLARGRERERLAASLTVNLSLNAAWSWLFFAARSPRAGLAGTLLLDVSTLHLIRTTSRTDRGAATVLLPYAAWCWFATALNARIAQLNPCS